jgi:hypothetical protein
MPEFPSDHDAASKSDKTMTIGLVLAGIVAALILVGSIFNQTSQERQVNQPSTSQSMADDNTKAPKVQE